MIKKIAGLFFGLVLAGSASVVPAFAAAPDGLGPWADSVVNFSQGLRNNGTPVATIRSNPAAALGIAEMTNADGTFTSLGFGGQLTLKFVNGISGGVFVFESTNLPYPAETAKIEVSRNGKKWTTAGTVTRSGSVNQPQEIKCAHYIRITDTSNPKLFEPTADGYDVDGVKAQGTICKKDDDKDHAPKDNCKNDPSDNVVKNSSQGSNDEHSSECEQKDDSSNHS